MQKKHFLYYFFAVAFLIGGLTVRAQSGCGNTTPPCPLPSGNVPESQQIVIPVVFHVVLPQNIIGLQSDWIQHCNKLITELNADYHDSDASDVPTTTEYDFNDYDAIDGDANIQFVMSSHGVKFANGNRPSYRAPTETCGTLISNANDVKKTSKGGSDPVDPERYLNVWICDIRDCGDIAIDGYAEFPWCMSNNTGLNGVVLHYDILEGDRPASAGTHEIGHWLGLYHTFGLTNANYDDCVPHTPLEGWRIDVDDVDNDGDITEILPFSQSFNCSTGGDNPVSIIGGISYPALVANYMSYAEAENCIAMFTDDQATRMRNAIVEYRPALIDGYFEPNESEQDLRNDPHHAANITVAEVGSPNIGAMYLKGYLDDPLNDRDIYRVNLHGAAVDGELTFTLVGDTDLGLSIVDGLGNVVSTSGQYVTYCVDAANSDCLDLMIKVVNNQGSTVTTAYTLQYAWVAQSCTPDNPTAGGSAPIVNCGGNCLDTYEPNATNSPYDLGTLNQATTMTLDLTIDGPFISNGDGFMIDCAVPGDLTITAKNLKHNIDVEVKDFNWNNAELLNAAETTQEQTTRTLANAGEGVIIGLYGGPGFWSDNGEWGCDPFQLELTWIPSQTSAPCVDPNDWETASEVIHGGQDMTLGTNPQTMNFSGQLISSATDEDAMWVKPNGQTGAVTFNLTNLPDNYTLRVDRITSGWSWIAQTSSNSGTNNESVTVSTQSGDIAIVARVISATGDYSCNSYTLAVNWKGVQGACSDPNDWNTASQVINVYQLMTLDPSAQTQTFSNQLLQTASDEDAMWIQPSGEAGDLDIDLTGLSADYTLRVDRITSGWSWVPQYSTNGGTSNEHVTVTMQPSDIAVVVRITSASGAFSCNPYTLTVDWDGSVSQCVDQLEPNSLTAPAYAPNIPGGNLTTTSSWSFNSKISSPGEYDGWKIPVNPNYVAGSFSAILKNLPADYQMELRSWPSFAWLAASSNSGNTQEVVTGTLPLGETGFVIQVYGANSSIYSCSPYTLDLYWTASDIGIDPCDAITLTPQSYCSWSTYTSLGGNTFPNGMMQPSSCQTASGGSNSGGFPRSPKWFKYVQPANGSQVDFTSAAGNSGFDPVAAMYLSGSGNCSDVNLFTTATSWCSDSDPNQSSWFPQLSVPTSLFVAGTTIYVAVWEYDNNNNGDFRICVRNYVANARTAAPRVGLDAIKVYPNPANTAVVIEFPNVQNDIGTIQAIGLDGRLLHEWSTERYRGQQAIKLPLPSTLAEGVIVLKIQAGSDVVHKRLTIVR